MKDLLCIFLLCLCVPAFSGSTREGYVYKYGTHQTLTLDIYEDLLCSDCLAFHPVLMKYLQTETYRGEPITNFVQVVFHIFPLPYHRNAFLVSQLVPFIYDLEKVQECNSDQAQKASAVAVKQNLKCGSSENVFKYIDYILRNQNELLGKSAELTESQVVEKLCRMTSDNLKFYTSDQCVKAMKNSNYVIDAVMQWKNAAHQGIYATPSILLNGEETEIPNTSQQWRNLILNRLNI